MVGFVAESRHSLSLLLTLCLVAGASERLVSGFIEQIDVTAAKAAAPE